MPSLHFKGKAFLQNYHHTVKFHKLDPQKTKGLNDSPSLDDNLIIHGDNLKALKALLPTHAGKIKCIYIDPPYNTGNEGWVYNDNVASPMIQKWLGETVNKDDLTRHDKWCCMMYPRLVLLKELLSDNGIIFISIDDNEVTHLKMMLDEIFSEENFLGNLIWKKRSGGGSDNKYFVSEFEYILCYAKDKNKIKNFKIDYSPTELLRFNKKDSHGDYYLKSLERPIGLGERPNLQYKIEAPDGKTIEYRADGKKYTWVVGKKKFKEMLENDNVIFQKTKKNEWRIFRKVYKDSKTPRALLLDIAQNRVATDELKEIFEKDNTFNHPKPSALIKYLVNIVTKNNDIILDSFAGSGTTGHAVLAQNEEDGGNRKFILIECEDYADKITAERLRRVIKGIPKAKDKNLQKGYKSTFSYYELGDEVEIDKILEGKNLPEYEELARYAFFTATGENWNKAKTDKKSYYIGSSNSFETFLLYEPDKEKLKKLALNLDFAIEINNRFPNKQKLVFAPACFMEEYHLKEYGIRFAQLPFEIYRMAE